MRDHSTESERVAANSILEPLTEHGDLEQLALPRGTQGTPHPGFVPQPPSPRGEGAVSFGVGTPPQAYSRELSRELQFPSPGGGGTARRRGPHVLLVVGVRGCFSCPFILDLRSIIFFPMYPNYRELEMEFWQAGYGNSHGRALSVADARTLSWPYLQAC